MTKTPLCGRRACSRESSSRNDPDAGAPIKSRPAPKMSSLAISVAAASLFTAAIRTLQTVSTPPRPLAFASLSEVHLRVSERVGSRKGCGIEEHRAEAANRRSGPHRTGIARHPPPLADAPAGHARATTAGRPPASNRQRVVGRNVRPSREKGRGDCDSSRNFNFSTKASRSKSTTR